MRLKNIKGASEKILEGKYFISNPKDYRGKWNKLFNNNNPIYIEIGMGKGDFIISKAINNPHINFIGLEKYTSIVARALNKLENLRLPNLRIINGDALNLNNIFDKEISAIYLNFSDPWPKQRHSKRRLTSSIFLRIYDDIFKSKCVIFQKTDNTNLFESSIISLTNYGYKIEDISLDLWSTDKFYEETEYERKFKNKGVKINYLKATK